MLNNSKDGFNISKIPIVTDKTVNTVVFHVWLWIMRTTCFVFLIVQSYMLSANFTFFCFAVMCLIRPTLGNIPKFRASSKTAKKLYSWSVMIVITMFAAYIWAQKSGSEGGDTSAFAYAVIAIETTLIIYLTYGIIWMVNKFKKRRAKKKA